MSMAVGCFSSPMWRPFSVASNRLIVSSFPRSAIISAIGGPIYHNFSVSERQSAPWPTFSPRACLKTTINCLFDILFSSGNRLSATFSSSSFRESRVFSQLEKAFITEPSKIRTVNFEHKHKSTYHRDSLHMEGLWKTALHHQRKSFQLVVSLISSPVGPKTR